MATLQERLVDMLSPSITGLGYELWGIEISGSGKQTVLRVFIDHAQGIGIEDCEKASRQVSSVMDVEDPIRTEYTLEVSSPGMDRPLFKLTQFEQSVGEVVSLRLQMPFEGRRKFKGLLKGVENEEVILEVDNEEYILPYELIDKANIVPQF